MMAFYVNEQFDDYVKLLEDYGFEQVIQTQFKYKFGLNTYLRIHVYKEYNNSHPRFEAWLDIGKICEHLMFNDDSVKFLESLLQEI